MVVLLEKRAASDDERNIANTASVALLASRKSNISDAIIELPICRYSLVLHRSIPLPL